MSKKNVNEELNIIQNEDEEKNSEEIISELAKEFSSNYSRKFFDIDREVFQKQKTALEKEINDIKSPVIKQIPDFLTNPKKADERIAVMDKIKELLKGRFSLVTIADILQCNDYEKLDETLENKENINKLVEKYSRRKW